MGSRRRSVIDRLGALLPLLRRGLVSDGDAEELFAALAVATGGATGFALGQDLDYRGWGIFRGIPDQWMRDHARLRSRDPSIPLLTRTPPGFWYASQRELARRTIDREFYECFVASGLKEIALVRMYSPFRDDLFFWTAREDRFFDDEELTLLELLYPHLAGALATRRALAVLDGSAPPASACVFVSFPGGTVRADAEARRAIERHTGRLDGLAWDKAMRGIATAARRFTHATAGGRSQALWRGLRVDFAAMPPETGETSRLVGFLIDEQHDGDAVDPVREPALVGAILSPRQLAVARDFASGMDVPTIAAARRLSRETVRTHLRNAYRRLGVNSRHALSRTLYEHGQHP